MNSCLQLIMIAIVDGNHELLSCSNQKNGCEQETLKKRNSKEIWREVLLTPPGLWCNRFLIANNAIRCLPLTSLVDGGRCLGNQIVGYCPSNNSSTCCHYGLSCYCTPWHSAKGCFTDHRDMLKQYRCRDTLMLFAQAIIDGGMGIAIT